MSLEVVIDGSVAASWVFPDESTTHSERLLKRVLRGDLELVLPELWEYEMLNMLRTGVVRKRIAEQTARRALSLVQAVPRQLVSAESQGRDGILSCALRFGLSA